MVQIRQNVNTFLTFTNVWSVLRRTAQNAKLGIDRHYRRFLDAFVVMDMSVQSASIRG